MREIYGGYYNGKTVLVTGHTGFKGSWLSIWLLNLGANVIGYSLDPYTPKDNFVLSGLSEKMTDLRGDIRDFDKLQSVFQKYKPEIVFHLAAQPIVRTSYELPRETFEQNVMGTVNVLECVRLYDCVKVCVNITSDKCYDNKEWIWGYRENDPMGGYDPYSASKGCSELVISAYTKSFFNPENISAHNKAVASARAGNVIGGGDWSKDRIIPDCIRAIEQGKPIDVRSPEAIRPWQHVLEPLSGYLFLGMSLAKDPKKYAGGWNLGPGMESLITVREIVDSLITYFPGSSWNDLSDKSQPHEAKLLNLDCSKAYHFLKWKPTLDISKCIEFVARWYSRYSENDVYQLCTAQIHEFAAHAKSIKNLWAL